MNNYETKTKENKPVIAICYDFDKTLSPTDMQAQGFIQSNGYDIPSFWSKSNNMASENEMDQNLAWMYMMKKAAYAHTVLTKKALQNYGANVKLFPGVDTWFDRINEIGNKYNVIVEHYIISSGLKEMIEGTSVSDKFTKIYASSFYYDEEGVAVWPSQVINYTNKTQFLFRISKGKVDINDPAINDYMKDEDKRVPFRNMIYIGDSDTDIPCMKLVNSKGGYSIGVYNPETKDKTKVYRMMRENRIKYFEEADYKENSNLEKLITSIIIKTAANEIIENVHIACENDYEEFVSQLSKDDQEKKELIIKLDESSSFASTHAIIKEMDKYEWTEKKYIEYILRISDTNSQIKNIKNDPDIKMFLLKIKGEL